MKRSVLRVLIMLSRLWAVCYVAFHVALIVGLGYAVALLLG